MGGLMEPLLKVAALEAAEKAVAEAIEMEKQLLSAMFMKEEQVVPEVCAIIDVDDLYRVEHRLVFQAIVRLYAKRLPIDYLAVEEELRKSGDFGKIDHRYLLSLIDATFTTARAEYHANIIKEITLLVFYEDSRKEFKSSFAHGHFKSRASLSVNRQTPKSVQATLWA